jgi:hypothetical protein
MRTLFASGHLSSVVDTFRDPGSTAVFSISFAIRALHLPLIGKGFAVKAI